jgi:opacity protein-like surface antigen
MRYPRIQQLLAVLFLALPLPSLADGAFLLKLGRMQLRDANQMLGFANRDFDASSYDTFAMLVEHRLRKSGIGLGFEYVIYRNDYTPPAAPSGTAETRAMLFAARKYFAPGGNVHPYIGLGVGFGNTTVEHGGLTPYSDEEFTTVFQGVAGVEFRAENFSMMLEVRHLYHDKEQGIDEYDPSATGVFLGFGFNW